MLRLMLLRHAKSDWSQPGARDRDRVLSTRGREAAPRVASYMARHGLKPDRVICSDATRTRETWEFIAPALSPPPPISFEPRLYDAARDTILTVIRAAPNGTHALLVVGHNPGLHDLADFVIATGDLTARQALKEKLPTAGLVVIDFTVDTWALVRPHSGRLDRFITPRTLEVPPE